MTKKRPVPFPKSAEANASDVLTGSTPLDLCGREYRIVFDMQAIGMIIAQTKYNVFVEGLPMSWLLEPKNMKATLDGALQRHHTNDRPTWKEIEAYITPENVQIIGLTLYKASQPAQPTWEQLERIGFSKKPDELKPAEEKEGAESLADPTETPESSSSGSGASGEAIYG